MSRLIDADAFKKDIKACTMSCGTLINTNTMLALLDKYPTAYSVDWIPVSDGLPEENIEVDVTIEEIDGDRYTSTSWLQEGQWVVKKSPFNPKVIAWKARPNPYQPKGE